MQSEVTNTCATGAAAVAAVAKQRRHLGQIREHPYQRAGALSWNNTHSQWRLVSLFVYIFFIFIILYVGEMIYFTFKLFIIYIIIAEMFCYNVLDFYYFVYFIVCSLHYLALYLRINMFSCSITCLKFCILYLWYLVCSDPGAPGCAAFHQYF